MFYAETLPPIDHLHRRPFARAIAQGLINTSEESSFTVGIESEWGTGKSTLLSYIVSELNACSDDIRPVVVEFSPWIVSGFSSLLESFFLALAERLRASLLPNGQRAISASRKVIKYLALLEHAKYLKYVPGTGIFGSIAEDVGAWAKEATREGEEASKQILDLLPKSTVEAQRMAVEKALADLGRKVVVTIDDIDRLTAEEIRQVFQLVKAIGALRGTRYVVTYDPKIVGRALSPDGTEREGRRYLEKIVQIQYQLPHLFAWQLHEVLQRHINDLVVENDSLEGVEADPRYSEAVAICSVICRTPRDALRLKNKLSISLVATRDAVNPADVLVYETLDLVFPEVTDAIRRFPRDFLGSDFRSPLEGISAEVAFAEIAAERGSQDEKSDKWKAHLPVDTGAATSVRRALFFLFDQLRDSSGGGPEAPDRIANIDVLQRLLLITGHPDQLDGAVARRVLGSPAQFGEILLGRREELVSIAQALALHAPRFRISCPDRILNRLFEVYVQLNQQRRLDYSETEALSSLAIEILRGAHEGRAELLQQVAQFSPLSLAHDVVLEMAQEHGLWRTRPEPTRPAGNRLIESESAVIEAIAAWRTRVASAAPEVLLSEARPMSILFRFDQLGNDGRTAREVFDSLWKYDRDRSIDLAVDRQGHLTELAYLRVLPPMDQILQALDEDTKLGEKYQALRSLLNSAEVIAYSNRLETSEGGEQGKS